MGLKRKIFMVAVSVFVLSSLVRIPELALSAPSGIIRVPQDYATITQAIDASNPGDTIIVSEGTYAEGEILVYKPNLTLVADGVVVVDGLKENDVFHISADNVTIKGFTVERSIIGGSYAGISLSYVKGCIIEDNVVQRNGVGIYLLFSSNNTVVGNYVNQNWGSGITLRYSNGNIVTNNSVINNRSYGIYLGSCEWNILSYNNVARNNQSGILTSSCEGTTLVGNTVTYNHYTGISLSGTGCILRSNTMSQNLKSNFAVSGIELLDYVHDIDTSNLVDGRQVVYIMNQHSITIDSTSYPLAGYIAVVNSTDVAVRNLIMVNNSVGVLFAYVTDSTIKNVTAKACNRGIKVFKSENIRVSECAATGEWKGISVQSSNNVTLRGNVLFRNSYGIYVDSTNTQVTYNTLTNNTVGGILIGGSNNTVVGNIIVNSTEESVPMGGIILYSGDNNLIAGNIVESNSVGIWMWIWVDNNKIFHNNFINNKQQVEEYMSLENLWDDGYPSGGNFWSDYNGTDEDEDGLGDTPYTVYRDVVDHYPLMRIVNPLQADINWDGKVDIHDIIMSVSIYGVTERDAGWNVFADLAPRWGVIDIFDLVTCAYHYGETYP